MKKAEIVTLLILSVISFSVSLYFYLTLFQSREAAENQKTLTDFPSPISRESVSKPSTFLGTLFTKNSPTPTPSPTPIPKPRTATEHMEVLRKSYSDGDASQLRDIRAQAAAL